MDDREARNDIRTVAGNYIHRHHVEPEIELCVRVQNHSQYHLQNIDVVRRTDTTLDVLPENCIDDYWSFKQFTILIEKHPNGYTWSEGAADKKFKQHQDPIIYGQRFAEECQKQLNEERTSNELSKNRSSTMLESWATSILIDPEDMEIRETIKNARKKLC